MAAIGRPWLALRRFTAHAQLVHQPPHSLLVDSQALTPEHHSEATVSVSRPCATQLSQGVFDRSVLIRPRFVVQVAPVNAQGLAE
jgi:hypothetical protein